MREFDFVLIEATDDVDDDELFDCLSKRDVDDVAFGLGAFGMTNKFEEPLFVDFFNDFLSSFRLSNEVECLSDSFSLVSISS